MKIRTLEKRFGLRGFGEFWITGIPRRPRIIRNYLHKCKIVLGEKPKQNFNQVITVVLSIQRGSVKTRARGRTAGRERCYQDEWKTIIFLRG